MVVAAGAQLANAPSTAAGARVNDVRIGKLPGVLRGRPQVVDDFAPLTDPDVSVRAKAILTLGQTADPLLRPGHGSCRRQRCGGACLGGLALGLIADPATQGAENPCRRLGAPCAAAAGSGARDLLRPIPSGRADDPEDTGARAASPPGSFPNRRSSTR
jgi:hypothetical protein